jgi:hypothetical protein
MAAQTVLVGYQRPDEDLIRVARTSQNGPDRNYLVAMRRAASRSA